MQILTLMVLALVGFILYATGETVRKQGLTKEITGATSTFPYKTVAFGLIFFGVFLMLLCAVLMYFAGGYSALFAKLGW